MSTSVRLWYKLNDLHWEFLLISLSLDTVFYLFVVVKRSTLYPLKHSLYKVPGVVLTCLLVVLPVPLNILIKHTWDMPS